jgi:hypothetical protein
MCYVYANLAIDIAKAKFSCYIYLFSAKAYQKRADQSHK